MDPLLPHTKIPDLVFGGAGVFVLLLLQGRMNIVSALTTLLGGLICAYVFPDAIMAFFHADVAYRNVVAFSCGLLGMQICMGVLVFVKQIRDDPIALIERLPLFRSFVTKREIPDAPASDHRSHD